MKKYQVETLVENNGMNKIWMDLADRIIEAADEQEAIEFYKDFLRDNCETEEGFKQLETMTCKAELISVTRTWKVYGADGHRQRESFCKSYKHDFSEGDIIRILEVQNSDITGTNDYTIVKITRNTAEECEDEMMGQISDGIFENSRVGYFEEI